MPNPKNNTPPPWHEYVREVEGNLAADTLIATESREQKPSAKVEKTEFKAIKKDDPNLTK